jgi:tetratricopeptide (TPR) repeat protein
MSDAAEPSKPNPEFMAEFQKRIEAYASAAEAGDQEATTQAGMAAFMLAGMEAINNPTPEILLAQEAQEHEAAQNWAGAEAAYGKLLALHEASGNPRFVVKPHLDLCRLFWLLNRRDEGWEHACAASEAGRKADMFMLLIMALDNEAGCALDRGEVERALAAASEAVQAIEPGKIFDHARARALIRRAECLLAKREQEKAEEELKQAWTFLESKVGIFGPGRMNTWARWWEVRTQAHLGRKETTEAREAITKAIEQRKQIMEMTAGPNLHTAAALLRAQDRLAAIQ